MGRKKKRSRGRRRNKKNSSSKAESSLPNIIIIPEDIVVEILSRLPLSSLVRFTCVSKQWRSLISNISATKIGSPKVLLVSKPGSRVHSFSSHSIDRHQHEVQVKSIYVPYDMIGCFFMFQFLGSCNGLLLMCVEDDLFLWNPLTRFFKKVLTYTQLHDAPYPVCSGLCYDSTSDEYKAVLALAHQTPEYGGEFVAVGSLRSKSWTKIGFPYMVRTVNSGPIVNGSLHWFASKNNSGGYFRSPHQIIYFNAHMNKFEEVPMPDPRGKDGDITRGLGVLDGYLCMSRSVCPEDSKSNIEVLIMKEYGLKNSWTILFVVPDGLTFSSHDTLVPLGYTKNGEVLTKFNLLVVHRWHIRAFNLTDNSHRRISIRDSSYVNDSFYAIIANEESLMTPADYDWDEDWDGDGDWDGHLLELYRNLAS